MIETLRTELTQDPLSRGYAQMTNEQAAASLNALTRTIERDIIDTWEIVEATVPAEWNALAANMKQYYQTIISGGRVNVRGTNTRAALGLMFVQGTQTRTNLLALQTAPASRATELGIPRSVDAHDIQRARDNG